MPRLYWKTEGGNVTLTLGEWPSSIIMELGELPAETALALSHELARHAGDKCPCHRVDHPQQFVDRLNAWIPIK